MPSSELDINAPVDVFIFHILVPPSDTPYVAPLTVTVLIKKGTEDGYFTSAFSIIGEESFVPNCL